MIETQIKIVMKICCGFQKKGASEILHSSDQNLATGHKASVTLAFYHSGSWDAGLIPCARACQVGGTKSHTPVSSLAAEAAASKQDF